MDPVNHLMMQLEDSSLPKETVMEEACKTINKLIPKANRVSFWCFENNGSQIRSLINYDVQKGEFSSGLILKQCDFPPYFKAILEEELVVASDARHHSVTSCFTETYFKPLDIHSLMDFILHHDFKPSGVLCCESQGVKVTWEKEDIDNLRIVASLISFCFDLGPDRPN